jgi:hypothetical protein
MASEGNLYLPSSHKMAKEIVKIIMGSINCLKRLSSQGTMTTTTMVGITGNNLKQATSTTTKSKGLIKTTMEKGKVVDITKKGQEETNFPKKVLTSPKLLTQRKRALDLNLHLTFP